LSAQDEREGKGEAKAMLAAAVMREREAAKKLEAVNAQLSAAQDRHAKAEAALQVGRLQHRGSGLRFMSGGGFLREQNA
jgi:hypothetical protein